jgi:calcineurin-like phosphoesterase family protein
MRTLFTADPHLGHANIIKYCNRPFTPDEMDDMLIGRFNERVSDEDTVYILGDFTLGGPQLAARYFARLNGHIFVVPSLDHDQRWVRKAMVSKCGAEVMVLPALVEIEHELLGRATLCHYPMASWPRSHYGTWHLHGHSHGTMGVSNASADRVLPPGSHRGMRVDVGVDCWNFYPVSVEQLVGIVP